MIKLDVTKEKKMVFYVAISGIDHTTLKAFYRLEINDIEYGFKCEVKSDRIECLIPPMRDVVDSISSDEVLDSHLDVYNNNECFVVWNGKLETKGSFNINVKDVSDGKFNISPTRKSPVVTDEFEDEEFEDDDDDEFSADDEDVIVKPKITKPVIKSPIQPQKKVLSEAVHKPVPVEKPKPKIELNESTCTDEFIKKFLISRGVTNEMMQENMMSQAREQTKNGRNLETLKLLNEQTKGWK